MTQKRLFTAHLCNIVQSLRSADGQRGVETEKSYRRNADVTAVQEERCHWPGRKPPLSQLTLCLIQRGKLSQHPLFIQCVYFQQWMIGMLQCAKAMRKRCRPFWERVILKQREFWLMLAKLNNITAMTLGLGPPKPALN